MTSRAWIGTIPKEDTLLISEELADIGMVLYGMLPIRYASWQMESGLESGYEHVQIYLELTRSCRLSQMKKPKGLSRAHWEPRRGTRDEARAYCMKEETRVSGPYEFGVWIDGPGHRMDTHMISDMVRRGLSEREIADDIGDRFLVRYRGIQRLMYIQSVHERFRPIHCSVIWGASGTGKTRYCYENYENIYKIPFRDGSNLWFDGYERHNVLLIDDFYGWIPYAFMLHLLDGYPLQLPVKGGFAWAHYTIVIITSNKPPDAWYSFGMTDALRRRLTYIKKM